MNRLATMTLALLVGGGCANFSGRANDSFDEALLNQTWYGAYHRPAFENAPRDERRASAARDRRSDRDERRAQNRAQRDAEREAAAEAREEHETLVAAIPSASSPPVAPTRPAAPALPDAVAGDYEPADAARYVHDVYVMNETPVSEGDGAPTIVDIYRYAQEHGTIYHSTRPAVGDLVFFHNTHDTNADGRPNDWYTHIGLVESVDEAGTVAVLGYAGGHVGRAYLNLERPDVERDGRTVLNSPMREQRRDDLEHTEYLSGRLFAGFGSLLGNRTEVVVLDTWHPEG